MIALGTKPGRDLGALLNEIEELQLDYMLHTREEALAYAKSRPRPRESRS